MPFMDADGFAEKLVLHKNAKLLSRASKNMKPLIIIPAYNEEANIVATVYGVIEAGYDYVVINDGSTDNTRELCRRHGFNLLDLSNNLGIGGAVQVGHKYAYEHGYDVDVQFDGDGQHDVSYVPALVEGIEDGADLIIGSRFLEKGSSNFKSTFMRRAGITWFSALIKVLTGEKVTDPTSGFRACSRRAIGLFCRSYPIDYPEPESIVEACLQNLAIKELPVSMNERTGGVSSIGVVKSAYYMVKVTLAILIVALKPKQR